MTETTPASRKVRPFSLPPRWRKPAMVAASVGFHALVLAGLGFKTMDPMPQAAPEPPILYLDIEPRPMLDGEAARVRPAPRTEATPERLRLPGSVAADRSLPLRDPREEDDSDVPPAPPSPRVGSPQPGVPAAPPASGGGWTVRPESQGDRVARGLRSSAVGCRARDLLSETERAICDDRFGEAAARAAPMTGSGDPDTDARFAREGRQRLAEYEARRRPLAGGIGIVGPQDGPGSNFGTGVAGAHLDPSLRPDSTSNIRTRRDGPRSSGQPLTPGAFSSRD